MERFLGISTAEAKKYKFTITQPVKNSVLVSNLPLFAGTAIPGRQIALNIDTIRRKKGILNTDQNGIWKYTPAKILSPGIHQFTVSTQDINNKIVTLTNIFEILKSGTQVLGDSTPSSTLAPTPTRYVVPTTIPSTKPTITPIIYLTSTPKIAPTKHPDLNSYWKLRRLQIV